MKSFLPNDIKDKNRKIVFDIFLQEPELAKVEVAERTTMSLVTVSKIVDYFDEIGIVSISGEGRAGSGGLGRKRVLYNFNPNSYLTIGIQVIAGRVIVVLINLYSEVIDTICLEEETPFYADHFIELLSTIIMKFQRQVQLGSSKIIGLGIGVDGEINRMNKTIRMRTIDTQKVEDYPYESILSKLESKLELPIILENDVNSSVMAEFAYLDRGGEGPDDLLQIALGQGIGAGLILNKRLHQGLRGSVGELEYMCFDTEYIHSPSSVGWLESKLNLDYLKKEFNFDPRNIGSLEEKEECVNYISKYLALSIINTVSMLGVQHITLSGETISALPNEIIQATRTFIRKYTGWELELHIAYKENSTAIGAAILALQSEMTGVIAG